MAVLRDVRGWLVIGVLIGATLVAFWPGLHNEFNYDDGANIVKNEKFRGLGWENLAWMFTTFHLGHYQPLSWVTLAVDYLIWGLNPYGFLLTNLLIHVLNVLLVFGLAWRLLVRVGPGGPQILTGAGRPGAEGAAKAARAARPAKAAGAVGAASAAAAAGAAAGTAGRGWSGMPVWFAAGLAALWWGVHPFRVESVSWVTERRDVLSSFFLLLTVHTYLSAVAETAGPRAARRWWIVTIIVYALSLLSRAMGITWPVVLLLLDWYPLRRIGWDSGWLTPAARRVLIEKWPFWVLAAAFIVTAPLAQVEAEAAMPLEQHGAPQRLAQAAYGLVFYLYKTIVPVGFVALYEIQEPLPIFSLKYIGPALLLLAAAALLVAGGRRYPWVTVVALLYAVILSPVLGFLQSGRQEVADRYSYLPMIGWMILLAAGWLWLWTRPHRRRLAYAGAVAGLAVGLGLVGLTRAQTRVWHDAFSLWHHAALHSPTATPLQNLAVAYAAQGRLETAVEHFHSALRLEPKFEMALKGLAQALVQLERWPEAEQTFLTMARFGASDPDVYFKFGEVLTQLGKETQAAAAFAEAVRRRPEYPRELLELGNRSLQNGELDLALRDYNDALRLDPDFIDAHVNRAVVLRRQGKPAEALAGLRAALLRQPRHPAALHNLGLVLEETGDRAGALAALRESVAAEPEALEARISIGRILLDAGQPAVALEELEEVIRREPGSIPARYHRARALDALKRTPEAMLELQTILSIDPTHGPSRRSLEALSRSRGQ